MRPGYDQPYPIRATDPAVLEKAVEDIRQRDPRLVQRAGYMWLNGIEYRVIGPGHFRPVGFNEKENQQWA